MSLGRLGRAPASLLLLQRFVTTTYTAGPAPSFVAHHLIDEFSRPRATRDAAHLRRLAAYLTPPAAESVILRLPSWRHALDFFRWATEQPGFRHSCYSLNAMASLLPPHQRAHLDRLATDALVSRCHMTPGALGFLLRRLGAAGLPDTASRVFDAARTTLSCPPNSYTYNCLLYAFAKAGRADDADVRLREMVASCGDDSVDSKWGKVEGAVELVGRMEALGMRPNEKTLNVLVHGFVKQGRVNMAMDVFGKMASHGFSADLAMFSVLIEGLCHGNEIGKAVKLFNEMKRDRVTPDVHLLKKITEAFCREGDFSTVGPFIKENTEYLKPGDRLDEAYEIFNKMKDLGLKPSEFTYNSLFYGVCRRKDPSAATGLLRDMRTNGHRPWIKNCTEMVQQLCFSGRITEALQFLDEMLKTGFLPDIVTYSAALNGMCRTGEIDNALGLFRDISSKYYLPDVVAHNILINGFWKSDISPNNGIIG
ncbi:hypothetical protein U9M48_043149 [Paspalum notatum var. saurae]|uniref:Pentatricopeptide repeat-containing protein n=1 Tax=Paspalum notatum var. saurae TaxID=547442 RepID=A0AAQ3XIC2_PASNO